MRRKKLIFLGIELNYAKRLSEYIWGQEEDNFDIRIYSEFNIFIENEKGHMIDILFLDEKFYRESEVLEGIRYHLEEYEKSEIEKEISGVKIGCVRILCEEKARDIKDTIQIYKYQSAYNIYMELYESCITEESGAVRSDRPNKTKIIGVFSPVNRCYKSTFSYALANVLSEKQKVLVINLEGCSGMNHILYSGQDRTVTDLIYEFMANRKIFNVIINKYINFMGSISYIMPSDSLSAIQDVDTSDWVDFIEFFRKNSEYDVIVIDIGNNACGIMDILTMCDYIFVPVKNDEVSHAKVESFYNMVDKYYAGSDIKSRLIEIEIPFFEEATISLSRAIEGGMYGYARDQLQQWERAEGRLGQVS